MLVLNSLWLFFHLVPLRSSSTNQFLSPCGFLSVTIILGKEFCGLYKTWCGNFFKFWACHLVIEFNVFWSLYCFCSSLAWHCEFTSFCIISEEKSNVRSGNSLVAGCCNQFSFCSLFPTGIYSFSLSCFFCIPLQVHQNPKGRQLPFPHDLQLYWSNISNYLT